MKTLVCLAAVFATAFSSFADNSLEDVSPHFSANTKIVWQASTNHLPQSLWVYRKRPRVFSVATISNAVMLASFQNKGFPAPSTNPIVIWADHVAAEPQPPYFAVEPRNGQILYSLGDRAPDSPGRISRDKATLERAWDWLGKLGIDRTFFVKTNAASTGVWGVFLPRQIDGIPFYDDSQGFSFQQLDDGRMRCFSLSLPHLERESNCVTASPKQIMACIRAFKTPSPPQQDEPDYFARIKSISNAQTLTIRSITYFYSEGVFGEQPKNDEMPRLVTPIAQLDAVAALGLTNVSVRLVAPILERDVTRLLQVK